MRDIDILQAAIARAIANGLHSIGGEERFAAWMLDDDLCGVRHLGDMLVWRYGPDFEDLLSAGDIIFSHEFAQAFWPGSLWGHYLQQMVLEPDPLRYLERFL